MPRAALLTPARLERLLTLRAKGDRPGDLAPRFGLKRDQVYGLISKYRSRIHAICARLGIAPPKRGGSLSGRRYHTRGSQPGYYRKPGCNPSPRPPKVIPCLGCQVDFESTWEGDRMCSTCKRSDTWRDGDDALQVAVDRRGVA